jgi:hypothetical protein
MIATVLGFAMAREARRAAHQFICHDDYFAKVCRFAQTDGRDRGYLGATTKWPEFACIEGGDRWPTHFLAQV